MNSLIISPYSLIQQCPNVEMCPALQGGPGRFLLVPVLVSLSMNTTEPLTTSLMDISPELFSPALKVGGLCEAASVGGDFLSWRCRQDVGGRSRTAEFLPGGPRLD